MKTTTKQAELLKILYLEDTLMDVEILNESLVDAGFNIITETTATEKEYISLLRNQKYDIILSDFKLPGFDGFKALKWANEICPEVPFICVSGTVGEEIAVDLIKHGAIDYILKDRLEKLPFIIKRALDDVKEKEVRKRAVEAMKVSELAYRRLFESAKDGILILDAESGMIVDVNPSLIALLGYSEEQFLQKKIWDIGEFENIIANLDNFLKLLQTKYIRNDKLLLTTIDNRHIPVEFTSNVYLVDNYKVIQCSFRNITRRKKIEEELLFRNIILSTQQESSIDGIFIVDDDANIISYNHLFAKMWDIPSELMEKKADGPILKHMIERAADPKSFLQKVQYLYENKKEKSREDIELKDGRTFERYSAPMLGNNSKNYGRIWYFRDITYRIKAEEALKSTETRYRRLFESAKDGILILDAASGMIVDVNPFLVNLLGYTTEQFQGKKVWEIGMFVDRLNNQANFLELQKKEYIRYDNMPLKTTDGREIAVEFVSNVYLADNHKVIQCNIRDITDRKKAEKDLKESEEKFRSLLENSADAIFIIDPTGKYIYSNLAVTALLGYSADEMLVKTISDLSPKDKIAEYFDIFKKIVESGKNFTEIELLKKDGNFISTDLNAVLLPNGTVFASCRDITKRKQGEDALAKEQYLMDSLMKNIPQSIYFKDSSSRFIRVSNNLAQKRNYIDPAQIVGKSDFDFFTDEHARNAYDDEQTIMRTQLPMSKEEKETWPDRPDTWVSTTKMPLYDKENNVMGTFGISMDITARKEMELLLLQKNQEIEVQNEEYLQINEELEQINEELVLSKEKAEESDRLKTAFLQNMSHEIRTPMNGILGFAELLKNECLSDIKQQEFIGLIERSGQRMLDIINDIVNISRIETGQIDIVNHETNINDLLKHLYAFFTGEAKRKGLGFSYKTELPDELSVIETDITKLTQVLSNLIKNALKFTKSGTIDFGYYMKAEMLEFYIHDTGIGIEPQKQHFIFERFRQVESTIARNYEGAGLGLSISKAFIEKLGGQIWLYSELGKGATFYFNIPYKTKNSSPSEIQFDTKLQNGIQPINILIVDDDDYCMQLIKEILVEEKVNLFFAQDGQEALNIVKSVPEIQIVLMDLKMPIMDGFESTQLIKKLRPNLPVIAQSAYAFAEDQNKAKLAGCDGFIGKPLNRELLITMINKKLLNNKVKQD